VKRRGGSSSSSSSKHSRLQHRKEEGGEMDIDTLQSVLRDMPEEVQERYNEQFRKMNDGHRGMEVFSTSSRTYSLKLAATEGEVEEYFILKELAKPDGVKRLEDICGDAYSESMYHNIFIILDVLLAKDAPFSAKFMSTLHACWFDSSRTWKEFFDQVVNAPKNDPKERIKFFEMVEGEVNSSTKDEFSTLLEENKAIDFPLQNSSNP